MMRNIAFPCIILMLVLVAGCSQENTSEQIEETAAAVQEEVIQLTAGQQEIVDKAVAIAKAIEATPEATAGVLTQFSMSQEEVNGLFYEIAASPALTSAYQEALGE